ncbi:hypothetical protein R3W88_011608 [Solanum pinnatisectum]|uniref:Uncharacterized protein n=2 Tax=Solanum pinnatisectum TaxID=50273 RepID=A0AAV9L6N3_9SOLN|nr:hypothetical protein R3W88_011608 [Solanum pinnatisectum]
MSHFNSLSSILNKNKWKVLIMWMKRNPDTCLTLEGYKYVLDEIKTSDKLVKADEMTRCYILVSMANNFVAKQTNMKAVLTTKMAEGSSVMKHVLNMMSFLNELEILMVLQTLPYSFKLFCYNYNMNKMDLSLKKLLNEMTIEESIISSFCSIHNGKIRGFIF